LTSWT